jgi:hypothetical protein
MEETMILQGSPDIYNEQYSKDTINFEDLNNKLFCTFTSLDKLDTLIDEIIHSYEILYNKIFVLYIKSNNEYACTYNISPVNVSVIPKDTILVHRKKESNTLYTINALNELIRKLNEGVVDTSFPVTWKHYKNSILLTQHNELKQLKTKLYKIFEV